MVKRYWWLALLLLAADPTAVVNPPGYTDGGSGGGGGGPGGIYDGGITTPFIDTGAIVVYDGGGGYIQLGGSVTLTGTSSSLTQNSGNFLNLGGYVYAGSQIEGAGLQENDHTCSSSPCALQGTYMNVLVSTPGIIVALPQGIGGANYDTIYNIQDTSGDAGNDPITILVASDGGTVNGGGAGTVQISANNGGKLCFNPSNGVNWYCH